MQSGSRIRGMRNFRHAHTIIIAVLKESIVSKDQRADMYKTYLVEEGYSPKTDDDGDVVFKYEGKHYCIIIDEQDEDFFRLIFPNFWSIDSEAERSKVLEAAVYSTAKTKVAKVFVVRDDTWAAIEMFCSPPEAFKIVFRRSLSALQAGINNFLKKMHDDS